MKLLVAGSSGFIGSHLTRVLTQRGHEAVGFDLREPVEDFGISSFVRGDIRNSEEVRRALNGVDAVINLAAVHFDFGHAPEEYWDTNERGTAQLLKAISDAGVENLLFTSSIAVYGDRTDEANEQTEPRPTSDYGGSKLAAERLVQKWSEENQDRCVVILRPCVVFGERNVTNMRNLIRQIDSGLFVLFGSGQNVKATAYVENLVWAIVEHVENPRRGVRLYNYADKPDLTVREIVAVIRQALGKDPHPVSMPLSLGILAALPFELVNRLTGKNLPVSLARVRKLSQPTRVAAQKIREEGYRQRIDTREGLRRMVEFHLRQKAGKENPQA